ncbi:transposase [Streptomyces iranensis]|uniref:Transposase n=1 Tax=Streptomyces iranensis TaxID=576784 RepID=A0ABS4MRH6_9ACTN|nr:transposase [Streptomyces iranensis]
MEASATGNPGSCDLREVVNALLHRNPTGCRWRLLPHDFPAWSAVFYYFTLWRQDGLDQQIQEILRCQVRARRAGRVLQGFSGRGWSGAVARFRQPAVAEP